MSVGNYNPKKVIVIWANQIFTNFTEDGPTVAFNNEHATLTMGLAGKGSRSLNNDRSGRITLPLIASADENDLLSVQYNLDRLQGVAVYPFLMKDENGTSLYTAETAWIVQAPEAQAGVEVGTREWILESDNIQYFTGGIASI